MSLFIIFRIHSSSNWHRTCSCIGWYQITKNTDRDICTWFFQPRATIRIWITWRVSEHTAITMSFIEPVVALPLYRIFLLSLIINNLSNLLHSLPKTNQLIHTFPLQYQALSKPAANPIDTKWIILSRATGTRVSMNGPMALYRCSYERMRTRSRVSCTTQDTNEWEEKVKEMFKPMRRQFEDASIGRHVNREEAKRLLDRFIKYGHAVTNSEYRSWECKEYLAKKIYYWSGDKVNKKELDDLVKNYTGPRYEPNPDDTSFTLRYFVMSQAGFLFLAACRVLGDIMIACLIFLFSILFLFRVFFASFLISTFIKIDFCFQSCSINHCHLILS